MDIQLANPRGFCAGVDRAINIVNKVLALHGAPIYVKHEIVHNRTVVDDFKQRGVVFIEKIADVPNGAILIFSAHGVSTAIRQQATRRQLTIYDATCPLVTKVHAEVQRLRQKNFEIIMIGHAGHPEVEGTLGQADGGIYLVENAQDIARLQVANPDKLTYVTQTTLSVDDTQQLITQLKQRFPNIQQPHKSDICYATQNRQDAIKTLSQQCDVILVVGSPTSSNSNRLCEVAKQLGKPAHLIDSVAAIKSQWFIGAKSIGITAGASAPENLVQELVQVLQKKYQLKNITELPGTEEKIVFSVPKPLLQGRHAK